MEGARLPVPIAIMPLGHTREKVLYGLSKVRAMHRYTLWRILVAVGFTIGVAILPLAGIMRFDLWSGRHMLLGEEVDLPTAAKGFAFPFLAVNIAILLVSRFLGRYLCGYVCPVGALSRISEWLRWHDRTPRQRLVGTGGLFGFCLLLAAITFSFWVDWRVFRDGSPLAIAFSGAFLFGTTGVLFGGAKLLGLRFCKDLCPSGIYFALLGPETVNGIEFSHPDACVECNACDKVCPMDLKPREMSGGEMRESAGLYPDELSNFALCIRCGDCVKACEAVTEKNPEPTPLRMGFLPEGARQALPPEYDATTPTPVAESPPAAIPAPAPAPEAQRKRA